MRDRTKLVSTVALESKDMVRENGCTAVFALWTVPAFYSPFLSVIISSSALDVFETAICGFTGNDGRADGSMLYSDNVMAAEYLHKGNLVRHVGLLKQLAPIGKHILKQSERLGSPCRSQHLNPKQHNQAQLRSRADSLHAGEPLNFAEVLASNPDWADQNADQSMDAGLPGGAQALDSSRNPGGGAEPAVEEQRGLDKQLSDRSLLDEALKLMG